MKILTAKAEELLQSTSLDAHWLFEIDWVDGTARYSTRAIALGGNAYAPWIASIERESETDDDALPPTRIPAERLRVRFAGPIDDAEWIGARLLRFDASRAPCRLLLYLDDPEAEAEDAIRVFDGVIVASRVTSGGAEIEAVDFVRAAGNRLVGRAIESNDIDPEARGRFAPWLFGRTIGAPLLPLRTGLSTRLRKRCAPGDGRLYVQTIAGFPAAGLLQVGDEIVEYLAIDEEARTFGTESAPLHRKHPAVHSAGAVARSWTGAGYEFLLADHPCEAVERVLADGEPLDESQWSAAEETIDGLPTAKIVFPYWPAIVRYAEGPSLLALENPANETHWAEAAGNTAASPLAAVDATGLGSSSILGAATDSLRLEFRRDLSEGALAYGAMSALRLRVRYWAGEPWLESTQVRVSVRKNGGEVAGFLPRFEPDASRATTETHTHEDTILDTVADLRALFHAGEGVMQVTPQSVEGEADAAGALQWANAVRAIDGAFETSTFSYGGSASSNTAPLVFRLKTMPQTDAAARLNGVRFHARFRRGDGSNHAVRLRMIVPGKADTQTDATATGSMETASVEFRAAPLLFADLIDPDCTFEFRVMDGGLVELAEAWLELSTESRLAGQDEAAEQHRTGAIVEAPGLKIALPTDPQVFELDATALALAAGDWAFFSSADTWPEARIDFVGAEDPALVHVADVDWRIEYRPRQEARQAASLHADARGLSGEAGLIENPADVAMALLTHARLGGIDPARIDSASLDGLRESLDERGFRFAARIDRQERIEPLLAAALFESGCRLEVSGAIARIVSATANDEAVEPAAEFDADSTLDWRIALEQDEQSRPVNDLTLLYSPDFSCAAAQRHRSAYRARLPIGDYPLWGAQARTLAARWLGDAAHAAAADVAERAVAARSFKPWAAFVLAPLRAIALDRGDAVALTHAPALQAASPGWVAGWKMSAPDRIELRLAIEPAGPVCWSDPAGACLEERRAHTRLVLFNGMRIVAWFDAGGLVSIAGEVIEGALGAIAMTAAIQYDAEEERVYFGAPEDDAFVAGFAIDAQGNLLLRGELVERVAIGPSPMPGCYATGAGWFALGCAGPAAAVARYEAADLSFRIRGSLREGRV